MGSVIYRPGERPVIEVLIEDTWHRGELRGWWDSPVGHGTTSGVRMCQVSWRRAAEAGTHIATVAPDRVRSASRPAAT